MFDYKLAAEIYKSEPWLVDAVSFPSLISILSDSRNGVELSYDPKNKLNKPMFLVVGQDIEQAAIIDDSWQLRKLDDDAEVISVIHLDGPITKNGGMSSYGTREMSREMDRMTNDDRVKGHILVTDSGGGASNATIFLTDSIKKSQQAGKPVVQFVEKGGLNASAAYHIGSHSDYIISENEENLVGSIGTMIEFAGYPKQHTRNSDGAVFVRAYATASINKNIEFEEAIKGNIEPVVNNILDPVNEKFLAQVKEQRPDKLTEEQLTGVLVRSKDAVGSLIDSIGTFNDAVEKVLELSNSKQIKNFNQEADSKPSNINLIKNENMDLSQLKQEHPKVYQAAFAEGVAEEQDRCGAWLAHSETDIVAVKEGIKSGKPISATQREEFLVKASSKKHVEDIKEDSPDDVSTEESKSKKKDKDEDEPSEADVLYNEICEEMNIGQAKKK